MNNTPNIKPCNYLQELIFIRINKVLALATKWKVRIETNGTLAKTRKKGNWTSMKLGSWFFPTPSLLVVTSASLTSQHQHPGLLVFSLSSLNTDGFSRITSAPWDTPQFNVKTGRETKQVYYVCLYVESKNCMNPQIFFFVYVGAVSVPTCCTSCIHLPPKRTQQEGISRLISRKNMVGGLETAEETGGSLLGPSSCWQMLPPPMPRPHSAYFWWDGEIQRAALVI